MNDQTFINKVYKIAFGADALEQGYSKDDVLNKLIQFSETSHIRLCRHITGQETCDCYTGACKNK